MKYIHPASIADAQLVSSSVAETDHAVWAAATAYTAGQRVIRTTGVHRIFERLIGGTTATAPESDLVTWVDVGPTNRWAMFDKSVGTVTSGASPIVIELAPGQIVEGVALLDLDCESVNVVCTVAAVEVYNRTFDPVLDTTPIIDWYSYFFESIARRTTVVITDLPPYTGMTITISIGGTGTVSCGTCVVGRVYDVGSTLYGAQVGITDYSTKTTNAYGATTVTQRGYARRMSARTALDAAAMDRTAARLSAVRATPVVWIGSDDIESTVVYGWIKDWGVDLALPSVYYCSLTVEGLV